MNAPPPRSQDNWSLLERVGTGRHEVAAHEVSHREFRRSPGGPRAPPHTVVLRQLCGGLATALPPATVRTVRRAVCHTWRAVTAFSLGPVSVVHRPSTRPITAQPHAPSFAKGDVDRTGCARGDPPSDSRVRGGCRGSRPRGWVRGRGVPGRDRNRVRDLGASSDACGRSDRLTVSSRQRLCRLVASITLPGEGRPEPGGDIRSAVTPAGSPQHSRCGFRKHGRVAGTGRRCRVGRRPAPARVSHRPRVHGPSGPRGAEVAGFLPAKKAS